MTESASSGILQCAAVSASGTVDMVGKQMELRQIKPQPAGRQLLQVRSLSLMSGGRDVLRDVNLQVSAGEIVGIAGVSGNGQVELIQCLTGLLKPGSGTVLLQGTDVTHSSVCQRRAAGMAYVPEDRYLWGSAPSGTLSENTLMKKFWFLALALALALTALAGCSSGSLPEGFVKEDVQREAEDVVTLLSAGEYDSVEALFSSDMMSGACTAAMQESSRLSRMNGYGSNAFAAIRMFSTIHTNMTPRKLKMKPQLPANFATLSAARWPKVVFSPAALVSAEIFFRMSMIIRKFGLRRPIYRPLSCYGHFGENAKSMGWEQLDLTELLKSSFAGAPADRE